MVVCPDFGGREGDFELKINYQRNKGIVIKQFSSK